MKFSKAGRKRKSNVTRDASGKSRGEIFDPSAIFKQPHRRDCNDPTSHNASFPLGRLHINGLLTEGQLRAGNEYAAVVHAYARAMGIPIGSPRSGSMSECISTGFYSWEGDRHDPDPEEAAKRLIRIKERYNECHTVLSQLGRLHGNDRKILLIMKAICIEEREEKELWHNAEKIGDLRLGLNAVQKILIDRSRA